MVIYLIENWFSGAHYRVFRGIGRAENQVDRGTFVAVAVARWV